MPYALTVPGPSEFAAALAAAGSSGPATSAANVGKPTIVELNEELCFDDGTTILRFEVHGRFTVVEENDGDRIGTGTVRTSSSVISDGRTVSATLDHSVFGSRIVEGVFQDDLVVRQSRLRSLREQSVAYLRLRLDDGAVVVDTSSMNGG